LSPEALKRLHKQAGLDQPTDIENLNSRRNEAKAAKGVKPSANPPPARGFSSEAEALKVASAELRRLIKLGHTKQSGIAAMKQAGWPAE
jgi:hypothetical protein